MKKKLFTNKEKTNINRIPLFITYNRTLPKISNIVSRNWNVLQVSNKFRGIFRIKPMIQTDELKHSNVAKTSRRLLEVLQPSNEEFLREVFKEKTQNLCPVVRQDHHNVAYK